jgi:hypothetical protein
LPICWQDSVTTTTTLTTTNLQSDKNTNRNKLFDGGYAAFFARHILKFVKRA